MRKTVIHKARVPMVVVSCLLGAIVSAACGGSEPGGKTGGGLTGGSTGKGGTVGVGGASSGGSSSGGKGGAGGTISVSGGASGSSGTSGTGAASGSLNDGEACVSVSEGSNKTEVALLFMVDISGSMDCPVPEAMPACEIKPDMITNTTRWTNMKPALESFFDSVAAEGMWAGITFFSRNNQSCNVRDYETPDAEIALLPGAKTALDQAVEAQNPDGQTPTVPALQGALNHADTWAAAHADQNVVVVYATDGYPKGCDNNNPANTIDNAAAAAAKSYMGSHTIRTYVLGIGPNLADLNKIAASGGTDTAFQIDTSQAGGRVAAQLTTAFDAIRSEVAVDCQYSVPTPPAGQTLDGNVNVTYQSGTNGTPTTIPFDDTGTCQEGWKYADSTQQQVVLCGTSCDTVKATANVQVDVAFGCGTVKITDPR